MKAIVVFAILAMTISVADGGTKRHKRLAIEPISTEDCQRIRDAVATYGIAIVEAGAAARGYTRVQLARARAYCL